VVARDSVTATFRAQDADSRIACPFREPTEGTLHTLKGIWWWRLAIFVPEGRRPAVGMIRDIDVHAVEDPALATAQRTRPGRSVCTSEPFQSRDGRTLVARFTIRFH
jgi:hypothetical protein